MDDIGTLAAARPETFDAKRLIADMANAARIASRDLAKSDDRTRSEVLRRLATKLDQGRGLLRAANQIDLDAAQVRGMDAAFVDRLGLASSALDGMIEGLQQLAVADDPIGAVFDLQRQPSGIEVGRMRVPIGVIGIIYESRPNVTIDAAALCIKSGNAVILRGGSEALHSNRLLGEMLGDALAEAGLPARAVQVVATGDRAVVDAMAQASGLIDVLIPRGGKALIARLMDVARVPMIKHLDGVCHVYIDAEADLDSALAIADNAKTQRYGTCNTMETLLVHAAVASQFLPKIAARYRQKKVEMRGDARARQLVADMLPASEADWTAEYLAPIIAVGVVDSLDGAIEHINRYGSHHTDAIVTSNEAHAHRFLREVDSASVMVNASTRFADGFEFGLGAEIGISNDKLHARGPVGLEGLTSVKYVVLGSGQVRTG
jgi:glutamate-5-semialdehyde dehydrogenase